MKAIKTYWKSHVGDKEPDKLPILHSSTEESRRRGINVMNGNGNPEEQEVWRRECAPAQEIGLNWLSVCLCVYSLCVWALGVAQMGCLCLLHLSGCGRSSCTSRTDRHRGVLKWQWWTKTNQCDDVGPSNLQHIYSLWQKHTTTLKGNVDSATSFSPQRHTRSLPISGTVLLITLSVTLAVPVTTPTLKQMAWHGETNPMSHLGKASCIILISIDKGGWILSSTYCEKATIIHHCIYYVQYIVFKTRPSTWQAYMGLRVPDR